MADDTAALQHAVDDGDGVLELTKGAYRITRPIVLDLQKRGYLGVRGDQGTARVVMAGPGPAFQIVGSHQGTGSPSTIKPQIWNGERMPIMTGLEILGEHPEADGIELLRTLQTTIENVLIRRCRFGVHLVERNRNFVINAAHIHDCHDTGVFFDECNLHQGIISSNHISYCKRAGIRQLNGDVHNIQITGNDIEYNSGYEGEGAEHSGEIVLVAPDGVISEYTISSNTLQATTDAAGANVLLQGKADAAASGIRLINITGNVLGSRDKCVVVDFGMKVSITGNTIYGGQALNVELRNSRYVMLGSNTCFSRPAGYAAKTSDGILLENCLGCSLVGNILNDCRLGAEEAGGAVTIRNSSDIMVSACQIGNPRYRGIDVLDSRNCHVHGNTISEDAATPRMLAAIRVSGNSQGAWIHGNSVARGRNNAIECDQACGVSEGNLVQAPSAQTSPGTKES